MRVELCSVFQCAHSCSGVSLTGRACCVLYGLGLGFMCGFFTHVEGRAEGVMRYSRALIVGKRLSALIGEAAV